MEDKSSQLLHRGEFHHCYTFDSVQSGDHNAGVVRKAYEKCI